MKKCIIKYIRRVVLVSKAILSIIKERVRIFIWMFVLHKKPQSELNEILHKHPSKQRRRTLYTWIFKKPPPFRFPTFKVYLWYVLKKFCTLYIQINGYLLSILNNVIFEKKCKQALFYGYKIIIFFISVCYRFGVIGMAEWWGGEG